MDEAGILADPADAGALGQVPFKAGARIGIPAILDRISDLLLDRLNEFLHPRGKDIVIVIAPGVGGNVAPLS